ncbi:uncharacterized protein LOC110415191 [Herrania umbratica]|nr:uncharacterized protein LOC110415191 [Herrania umbratica]
MSFVSFYQRLQILNLTKPIITCWFQRATITRKENESEMAMPWVMTLWMAEMVWIALSGWVSSCLTIADEVADSLRSGDIGPFHVG